MDLFLFLKSQVATPYLYSPPNLSVMPLKVIGAGFGRTGTQSLKLALEQLDFGKCYHMSELFAHADHIGYWEKIHRGQTVDFEELFEGYQSAVDIPASIYYRKWMELYPQAKVILSIRETDKWYESASKTIFRKMPAIGRATLRLAGLVSSRPRYILRILKFIDEAALQGLLNGSTEEHHAKTVYEKWNEEVKKNVPDERLLVFNVKEGWPPLCRFLQVPVPDAPFPRANDRESFNKRNKAGALAKSSPS